MEFVPQVVSSVSRQVCVVMARGCLAVWVLGVRSDGKAGVGGVGSTGVKVQWSLVLRFAVRADGVRSVRV